MEEEGQRKAGCWDFSWALKEAPSLLQSLQSQTSSWLFKRKNTCQEKRSCFSVDKCILKHISHHFSSLSAWTVSEWTEEAASLEVLCCQRMRSLGGCWGDVWVWLVGSDHHVGIGCQSNLRSPDSYPRRRQHGRIASVAPWRRHKSEGTGPGRPAWS